LDVSRGISDGAMPTARARAWALSSLQGDRIGCKPGHERRYNAPGRFLIPILFSSMFFFKLT
jgi:hypothetical protein